LTTASLDALAAFLDRHRRLFVITGALKGEAKGAAGEGEAGGE